MSPTAAEALEALEKLSVSLCTEPGPFPEELAAVEVVRAFIEGAGADSERYRLARDTGNAHTGSAVWLATGSLRDGVAWLSGAAADATIDGARARSTTPAREPTPPQTEQKEPTE